MTRARDDFRRSNRLFPTSLASYKLGIHALVSGDRDEAKQQFQLASKGKGEYAELARAAYARLAVD